MRQGGRTVLIVDDEPEILVMLRVNLEAEGYATALASDGQTALRRIADEHPDLVLLDVMMPFLDGWQVLESLGHAGPPVVVVSAKSAQADVNRALDLGAVAYVAKPYDPDDLIAVVARVLDAAA